PTPRNDAGAAQSCGLSTARRKSDASLVFRIRVLGGRLPGRDQQPGKLDLRLLGLALNELDQKFPSVAVVEEESHLSPGRRESLIDPRPLDAPCLALS